jgi:hypothetical protein
MPIEIKELHIRVTVNAPQAGQPPAEKAGARGGSALADEERNAIVAECAEQVFQILQRKSER